MRSIVLECEAILFDMDGTLVDSRALVERMWLRWADRRGVSPEAILAVAHGRRTLETMQIVAPQFATPAEAAQLDAEEEEEAREHGGETAVPGAAALLAALPPERWAIVTSALADIARRRVAGVGLPVPRVLVGAADVVAGKPDPEGYLRAAEALGFAARRCVIVEDAPPGVQAGRAAGGVVLGILTTYRTLRDCVALLSDLRSIEIETSNPSGALRVRITASGRAED
jgi:mannitol-1-/sugar-/sorbitol-6-phosphatase